MIRILFKKLRHSGNTNTVAFATRATMEKYLNVLVIFSHFQRFERDFERKTYNPAYGKAPEP